MLTTDHPPIPATAVDGGAVPRARRPLRMILLVVIVGLAGIATARFAVGVFTPHLYGGTVLQGGSSAPDLDGLVMDDGDPANLARYEGEVVLMFFGYTSCPDVCPTTLATAASAVSQLDQDDVERTNLIMVSVDPDRDDSAQLGDYVRYFHPTFTGATGDRSSIDRVSSQYGVFYELGEGESYTVDHTASLMAIDRDGVLRVIWSPEVTADQLASDIRELLS